MESKDIKLWKDSSEYHESLINDAMIYSSIKRAKKDHRIFLTKCLSFILIPLLTFTILINTNQQFVSALDEIPIVNHIIEILKFNSSIYLARNSDIFQPIDQTYETDDYILYLESMIVDEDQMIFFYQFNTKNHIKENAQLSFNILNYKKDYSIDQFDPEQNNQELLYFIFDPEESININKIQLEVNLKIEEDIIGEPLYITIHNDLNKVIKGKEITLNKEMIIDNQKIYIEKLTVYPLRTIITLSENTDNTYRILEYEFSIKTDDSQKINQIKNGVTAKYYQDYTEIMLESPYLIDNDFSLYLDHIYWVEKDKEDLIFDLNTNTFINLPDHWKLISVDDEYIKVFVEDVTGRSYMGLGCSYISQSDDGYELGIQIDTLDINENNQAVIKNDIGTLHEVNREVEKVNK